MLNVSRIMARAGLAVAAGLALITTPLAAQDVESVDPDAVYNSDVAPIDGDLAEPTTAATNDPTRDWSVDSEPAPGPNFEQAFPEESADAPVAPEWSEPGAAAADGTVQADSTTYGEDDLIGAAEGVFGKGAEGLAGLIEGLLRKQGEPNGYIVGREASGAFVVGARYGSGTLHHKIEGKLPVYWTGPSIGFDAGANAGNTFVLVYNLYDTEELYERYPAGEGQAYLVGGMHASYLRKGDVVLIPIRVGAGLRLGVNAGYMKFSKKQRWLPF